MRSIIFRKIYDTETAQELAEHWNGIPRQEPEFQVETLFRSPMGTLFLHGEGGPSSEYAKEGYDGPLGGEDIRLLSEEDALQWCENHNLVNAAEVHFPHLVEEG